MTTAIAHDIDDSDTAPIVVDPRADDRSAPSRGRGGVCMTEVRRHLGPHLLRRDFAARRPAGAVASWGCCYVAAEALYHLLGGRLAGWRPFSGRVQGEPHWWLVGPAGEVLDPTADQFAAPPDYTSGVGKGFLTRTPSRRARLLIAQVHGAIEVRTDGGYPGRRPVRPARAA